MTIDVTHRGVTIITESDLTDLIDRCLTAEALAARYKAALAEAEWGIDTGICPSCGNRSVNGHAEDCALAAVLAEEPTL